MKAFHVVFKFRLLSGSGTDNREMSGDKSQRPGLSRHCYWAAYIVPLSLGTAISPFESALTNGCNIHVHCSR